MIRKRLYLVFLLFSTCILSGCTNYQESSSESSDICSEYINEIDELKSENDELEQENSDLKQKLDEIQSMSAGRDYNYSDTLDDIEAEADY